jgi:hypothetical protein
VTHVDVVQRIYEAFGRGDVPVILEHLAEDVEWEYGANSTDVPWLQPRRGRAEVGQFFASLAGLDIRKFQPKTLLAAGDTVVALIDLEATVRATSRQVVEEDEVHVWHFGADGRIRRFRHRVDTHQHWAALHGKG